MTKTDKYQFIDLPNQNRYTEKSARQLALSVPTDMRFVEPVTQLLRTLCVISDPRAAQDKYIDDISTAFRESCSHLVDRQADLNRQFEVVFFLFDNRIEIELSELLNAEEKNESAEVMEHGYPLHQIATRVDKVSYKTSEKNGVFTLVKYYVMPSCDL